jgi:hypothetical protein
MKLKKPKVVTIDIEKAFCKKCLQKLADITVETALGLAKLKPIKPKKQQQYICIGKLGKYEYCIVMRETSKSIVNRIKKLKKYEQVRIPIDIERAEVVR